MLQARSWLPRTEGSVRLELARRGEVTALAVLHQAGAARARFPNPGAGAPLEAVLLNTAGGLTGGDRIDVSVKLGADTEATVTTAAAEKVYRSSGGEAEIDVRLTLAANSRLAWLPQSTILFDQSRLHRCTTVELAPDARFFAVETLVFGRMAMGEDVRRGAVRDAWRIRRGGALVFADAFRVEGAIGDALDRSATLDGARAVAMLLYAAPDAAKRVDEARALLERVEAIGGVSTWDDVLLVRAMARDGNTLQRQVAPLVEWLSGRPLPRIWQC